jgi:hypothetical protein
MEEKTGKEMPQTAGKLLISNGQATMSGQRHDRFDDTAASERLL